MSAAVMEATESRFAHLLQPIRELTRNWDVDVAAELNDYLEEVKCCRGGGGACGPGISPTLLLQRHRV